MKAWAATGLVLLVAGAVVAVLLVDPNLWRSEGSSATHVTVHVAPGDHARATKRAPKHRARNPLPTSPFALRPAPAHTPVDVRFAPSKEPRAGILFDIHTGRILWQHD